MILSRQILSRKKFLYLICLLFSCLLAACSHSHSESTTLPIIEGELVVVNAAARAAIAGSNNSAAYMTVLNGLDKPVTLVAVQTEAAASAMLHETVRDEDDMVRMEHRPDGFEIPAGEALRFEPGGKHIMLMDLQSAFEAGSEVEITFLFEDEDNQTIMVPVKSLDDLEGSSEHYH